MGKRSAQFTCQACGASFAKWSGKCDACGAWNTLAEEAPVSAGPGHRGPRGRAQQIESLQGTSPPPPRFGSGIGELDRVCGGGLVPGASLLIGGDPGIGKSTLLLQAACAAAQTGPVLYVTGEEAVDQVRMRAQRLGLGEAPLSLLAATNVGDVLATLRDLRGARLVIIDSVQTMFIDALDSAPGTVAQVRSSAQAIIQETKARSITAILVGHVTKDGQIAGPRVLEHMVDSVLYFEGDRSHHYRILRTVKNRFGPTDEIGVFEMTGLGLHEIANPSDLFLAERRDAVPGTAVFAGIEGSRPLLSEIQALVGPAPPGNARRAVVGWDSGRLAMVLAVLDARGGLSLAGMDVYLSVVGGLRLNEPGADLAVAAALISAASGRPVPPGTVAFGELGLTGEIRPIGQPDLRLREAAKLGFETALLPADQKISAVDGMAIRRLGHIAEMVALLSEDSAPARRSAAE